MTVQQRTISCLLPRKAERAVDDIVDTLRSSPPSTPFNEVSVAFVGKLSRSLLTDASIRAYPELMALAHWFRPARLADLRDRLRRSADPGIPVAKGLVFHVAPANVDSVFVYSWLLSLLCGNTNLIRVSRRSTAQLEAFFGVARRLMQDSATENLGRSNIVLTYDHDTGISSSFSSLCQVRVVWGGDATVEQMRAIPLPALSSELAFPNRFSLAVINSREVVELSAANLIALGRNFYNDAFWFDQQACSSPRVIVWIGDGAETEVAQRRFWVAVDKAIAEKSPENAPASVMNRLTTTYRIAQSRTGVAVLSEPGALPARVWAESLGPDDRLCHDGNGLFIELARETLAELPRLLSPLDQTIAAFGFERADWLALLPSLPPHSADRIVPIGSALEFNSIWDGQDFLRSLTRTVTIT